VDILEPHQPTIDRPIGCPLNNQKFFASFFQKRSAFFLFFFEKRPKNCWMIALRLTLLFPRQTMVG